ncbi:MAG: hypothetical protein JXD18_08980 [Anaerolineae bacterium]|nr:hypothetical protein [Anaerolineae bacterium]
MKLNRSGIFNTLSVGLLGLTALTILAYLMILISPTIFYNPFPPRTLAPTSTPEPTPTPTSTRPAIWTPTPTRTPLFIPTPSPRATRTPTPAPQITFTWPPTVTPTPRATRSAYPFTCEIVYRRPEYDGWAGVAGHFEDLDGNPLPGYHAQVECPGVGIFTLKAGDNERYNLMYNNPAAWEQACNPSRYQAMEIRAQMFNDQPSADGNYRAVSEPLVIQLGDYSSRGMGYIICTLNWEEWY